MKKLDLKDEPHNTLIERLRDQDKAHWVRTAQDGLEVISPLSDWGSGSVRLTTALSRVGIFLAAGRRRQLEKRVEEATAQEVTLISRPGWCGSRYAFADGGIVSPPISRRPLSALPQLQGGRRGSHAAWRSSMDALLSGQALPRFVLFSAFAGPLLRFAGFTENPGFELYGPKETLKSTLLRVAGSVWGDPNGAAPPVGSVRSWSTTVAALECAMRDSCDGLIALDEANLVGGGAGSPKSRSEMKQALFVLAQGFSRARFGADTEKRSPFIFLSSSNDPLEERLIESSGDTAGAAHSRLISLYADAGAGYGAFDRLPPGLSNVSELGGALHAAIRNDFGVASREFVKRLVRVHRADPAALRHRIETEIAAFNNAIGVKGGGRVERAFGIVAAAGALACEWGVVPRRWKPLVPCKKVYKRYVSRAGQPETPLRRLATYAATRNLHRVRRGQATKMSDTEFDRCDGWLNKNAGGRELILTPAALRRAVGSPSRVIAAAVAEKCLVTEGANKRVKRVVRKRIGGDRLYVFDLDRLEALTSVCPLGSG